MAARLPLASRSTDSPQGASCGITDTGQDMHSVPAIQSMSSLSYFHQQDPAPSNGSPPPHHLATPHLSPKQNPGTQHMTIVKSDPGLYIGQLSPGEEVTNHGSNIRSSPALPAIARGKFTEEWDASQRGSRIIDNRVNMLRTNLFVSNSGEDHLNLPSRHNTLKKQTSLRKSGSLKRSESRKSAKAGSIRSLALQSSSDPDEMHSAFHCPVPTSGNPTEALAARFQSWRKILKDLIAYYREIQTHYELKSKSLLKLANVTNNISTPPSFLGLGGIDDALQILRVYHKSAILESNKARDIEEDVILALTGLRSDLHQKIKEIKNLSGDFKNSVDKEMDSTRKVVQVLQDTLVQSELDASSTTGKQDPYLLRLAVDRQVERQIDEENYLHQAYLNLENSGRELESIVVGEVQKAYNAYAGILKRESDAAYGTIDELRIGPISMPKDHEWLFFVQKDKQFVDSGTPIRTAEHIQYPGRDHVASQEIRGGLLERKSKYLKSYTAGWYVLSSTHLHEFKSADKGQAPVMSLFLPEQKLGSHSTKSGSSNKFILKGRQTGSMHRGHSWVFRAESHDTMMAWYDDIKVLTENTAQERTDFVRGHVRSLSQSSNRSTSSDGVLDDDDDEPYSADTAVAVSTNSKQDFRRPEAGGRFPSDIQVHAQRGSQIPASTSPKSGFDYSDETAAVKHRGVLGSKLSDSHLVREHSSEYRGTCRTPMDDTPSHAVLVRQQAGEDCVNPYTNEPISRSREYHQASALASRDPDGHIEKAKFENPPTNNARGLETPGSSSQHGLWMNVAEQRSLDTPRSKIMSQQPGAYSDSYKLGMGSMFATAPMATGDPMPAGMDDGYEAAPRHERLPLSSSRPTSGTTRTDSVPAISNLHVPGEYPNAGNGMEGRI